MAKRFKKTFKKGKKPFKKSVKKGSIKKMIRREIARDVENKTYQAYDLGKDIVPHGNVNWTASIEPVAPASTGLLISQGVGQGQRIGNKIKIKKLTLKGIIHPKPFESTTNNQPIPYQVKFWFFYDKEYPTDVPSPSTDFFQFGNTVTGFVNDLTDMFAPINTDKYKVLGTRTFKVGPASNTAAGSANTFSYVSNNDFKWNCNFSIDLTKMVPKVYTFRDNNANSTTRGLYWLATVVSSTGSQLSATQIPLQMSYVHNLVYEDA